MVIGCGSELLTSIWARDLSILGDYSGMGLSSASLEMKVITCTVGAVISVT